MVDKHDEEARSWLAQFGEDSIISLPALESPYPWIAKEQIVDPASGEVLALDGQLLSGGDMDRILSLESLPEFSPTNGGTDGRDFYCYNCDPDRRDILRGYDIEFGCSCPRCEYPRWVLKESV